MEKRDQRRIKHFNLSLRIVSYKIFKFSYREPEQRKIEPEREDFKIDYSVRSQIILDKNLVSIRIGIIISTKDEPPLEVGELDVVYFYEVKGLEYLPQDENGLFIPDHFLVTLISLSISTTRGLLLGRGAGTLLEKIILPIIDPKLLLQKKNNTKKKLK